MSDRVWCKPTVAVDLDMTLTAEQWTAHEYIADPAPHSKRVLERFVAVGWQVIIYTCRPDCHMVKQWHQLLSHRNHPP
jgi:hydroxymethylpyrimidine pyrophosphatase-like HAD family hydrolase